jgi:hypothetical protein
MTIRLDLSEYGLKIYMTIRLDLSEYDDALCGNTSDRRV